MTDTEAVLFALAIATLIGVSVWVVTCGTWDDDERRELPPSRDVPLDLTGRRRVTRGSK